MKWSEVAQSCPTLCNPVDCSPSSSSVHGILQARILEWVAISFSRGPSWPRDQTQVSRITGRHFNLWENTLLLCFFIILNLIKFYLQFFFLSRIHKIILNFRSHRICIFYYIYILFWYKILNWYFFYSFKDNVCFWFMAHCKKQSFWEVHFFPSPALSY